MHSNTKDLALDQLYSIANIKFSEQKVPEIEWATRLIISPRRFSWVYWFLVRIGINLLLKLSFLIWISESLFNSVNFHRISQIFPDSDSEWIKCQKCYNKIIKF